MRRTTATSPAGRRPGVDAGVARARPHSQPGHGRVGSRPGGDRHSARPDLFAYERALARAGLTPVAGVDEAGRGACAGPLVVGAVILPPRRPAALRGLADSKQLTPAARERMYDAIVRTALAWSVVVVPAAELDRLGLHVANVEAMRRAVADLAVPPAYVLTDGFPVGGLAAPGLAVPKGDEVVACIAAASVIAKVTRDRIMVELHDSFPMYDFAGHKGYVTAAHREALARYGPCPHHRRCFVTVRNVAGRAVVEIDEMPDREADRAVELRDNERVHRAITQPLEIR